ncbi:MAG: peptidyl-tRNA hydrolase [Thermoplasmata archaeon]|nr:peptidyl-tRNA hydrolase [Thermoplasmata archaeon]
MYKMVIMTNDIEMSCGKMAAQAAHAAVEAALLAYKKKRRILKKWRAEGAKKVVVRTDEKEMLELEKIAREKGMITAIIRDAGLTELQPGTLTAIAIGPDEEEKIDEITGYLPLK